MPDFYVLPRYGARRFVPEDFQAAEWPPIETLYDQLVERNLASVAALEQFLRDWNELDDVLKRHDFWSKSDYKPSRASKAK